MELALRDELVSFAEELADAARKEILPFWRKRVNVESKIENGRPVAESPVTVADRNAESAMRRMIETRYPQHGIYGEEFGTVRSDAEFVWVLDPIDGTKSFITGKPLFGTLIGLCHHGQPIIGIVDQCVLKERWVGIVGHGTTLNQEKVETDGVDMLSDAMLYATTPHMFATGFEATKFEALRSAVKRPLYGSDCYAYALVASGFGADLVVEADLGLYDYAGIVPVILGAGGQMTDWQGRELNIQNHEQSRGRVIAAANSSLHQAALRILHNPDVPGADTPASVVKPHLRDLQQYKPPLEGRNNNTHLLLDFNERTTPVAAHVTDAVKSFIDTRGLHCYPAYGNLQARLAEYAGVKFEECMFTNGSDQGIDLVVRCCCPQGTEAIIPSPYFAMYEQAALTEGLHIKTPHFTREGGFPLEEIIGAVGPQTSLIVVSNTNNPTGTEIPCEMIRTLLKAAPHCAVLVDECYYELMDPDCTMKDEVSLYPNLFVTRTLSKTFGLSSLRLGYLLSADANIRALCCVRGPYDVNTLAAVAAIAALDDPTYMTEYVNEVRYQSKPALEEFLRGRGIVFWPSSANYILCYFEDPSSIEAGLRARGILVRPKKDAEGTMGIRISIGTLEQTKRLVAALEEILSVT